MRVNLLCTETSTMLYIFVALLDLSPSARYVEGAVTVAGQADGSYGASVGYLNSNSGISISDDDTLFIADTHNDRIVMVTSDNRTTAFGAGPGISLFQFDGPYDVSLSETAIYVLDTNNYRVKQYARNGTNPRAMRGAASFSFSYYLFVDISDNFYISDFDSNQVIRFAAGYSISTTVAGNRTRGSGTDQLYGPTGLFVDDNRTVYVADYNNHRVQKWAYGASVGTTVAGNGVAGNELSQLNYPAGITVDANEYIYIADQHNSRVMRWAPSSDIGVCIAGCSGSRGTGANQLDGPRDLAFDAYGSLYVSDTFNNRVQKFALLNSESRYFILE
jgi:streptogramin lyase